MKLIIAGSRTFLMAQAELFLERTFDIYKLTDKVQEIVHGGCPRGPDHWAERFAVYADLPSKVFQADWEVYGKSAGPIRNKQMAEYADALLLIWDGKSRGSANMKKEMLYQNKSVYEIIIK